MRAGLALRMYFLVAVGVYVNVHVLVAWAGEFPKPVWLTDHVGDLAYVLLVTTFVLVPAVITVRRYPRQPLAGAAVSAAALFTGDMLLLPLGLFLVPRLFLIDSDRVQFVRDYPSLALAGAAHVFVPTVLATGAALAGAALWKRALARRWKAAERPSHGELTGD
ncbi:MAG TPA: hypothetical protein VF771_16890 [Longimicrobiaceae bacterium]